MDLAEAFSTEEERASFPFGTIAESVLEHLSDTLDWHATGEWLDEDED